MNTSSFFLKRRQALTQQIGPHGIAIFPSAPYKDDRHIYRQDSDFYYLTGFEEPESVAVLYEKDGVSQWALFSRPENPETAVWTGPLAGQRGACQQYGADHAYPITQLEASLLTLMEGRQQVFYPLGRYPHFDHLMLKLMDKMQPKRKTGVVTPIGLMSSDVFMHEMRLVKDAHELACMRTAAKISADAHRAVIAHCRPGHYEYELKAQLLSAFISHGAEEEAYPSIVGGGRNSCILHYNQNKDVLNAGELVLIDAGASYQYYASDITRTFPVAGCFTAEQAAVYEVVLAAQLAVIEQIKPGTLVKDLQNKAIEMITQGLLALGFLKGNLTQLIESKAYAPFYMHGVSHWLGIDVHDVGSYHEEGQSRALKPGMVLTVEPGIYLSGDRLDLPKKWQNIGVRIEDDVLVTETGYEVLSQDVPKTIREIERLKQ